MTLLLSLLLFGPRLALAADAPESSGVSGALEQTGAASSAEKEAFANAAVTELPRQLEAVHHWHVPIDEPQVNKCIAPASSCTRKLTLSSHGSVAVTREGTVS